MKRAPVGVLAGIGLATALLAGCTSASHGTASIPSSSPKSAHGSESPARKRELITCQPGIPSPAACYTPQELQRAYGVTALLMKGIDGSGETVVLPEDPALTEGVATTDIRTDLAAFDKRFDLPQGDLEIRSALGYDGDTAQAGFEELLDVEIVHAIAPGATIQVVLHPQSDIDAALGPIIRDAAERGEIVSASFGHCQQCLTATERQTLHSALELARQRHVTVVAASGDSGAASTSPTGQFGTTRSVGLPSSDPLALGVGGTDLRLDPTTHAYLSESAWYGTGGGFSRLYARPSYQDGVHGITGQRGVPDVAADAASLTGMTTVASRAGKLVMMPAGGTSAAAPVWAGIAALANQEARRPLGFLNAGLYRIAQTANYHSAFHDVTDGSNSVTTAAGRHVPGFDAGSGWDPVTGLGTPNAAVLVPLLRDAVHPSDGQGL